MSELVLLGLAILIWYLFFSGGGAKKDDKGGKGDKGKGEKK